MTTAFISYSAKDEKIAVDLHSALENAGIKTFLAGVSLEAGINWTDAIFSNLKKANIVFYLASKSSIESHAVQQELGASLGQKKTIVPLLLDVDPEDLPGWVRQHQAIKITDSLDAVKPVISKLTDKMQDDKFIDGLICGALLVFFLMLMRK